jgi:CitMHS family citrate-Mg2+:H+ or citrate-Ca2+:H+ symporter
MIAVFMVLIMARITSAVVALILVPTVFGLIAGYGTDLAKMAIEGISDLAPTCVALVFAVLYFGIMTDAGLFDPLVRAAVRFGRGDPLRVCLATAIVAVLVSVDGDGATTAIVTIGAFLPIYRRLNMNPLIIAVVLGLANSTVNLTPWGGPSARAAAALKVDMAEIFVPLIPTILAGVAGTLAIAWFLGSRERRRLGVVELEPEVAATLFDRAPGIERPRLRWVNLSLTLILLAGVISQLVPLPIAFMIGLPIAITINYPRIDQQRERLTAHAGNVLPIVLLIFGAGVFTGILDGTGMVDAMGKSLLSIVPDRLGPYFGPIIALLSGPLTFVMANDAYYFGVVPVVAEAAGHFGMTPVEVARASLLGVVIHAMSPLIVPIYLVAGLLKREVGDLQRFALPYAVLLFLWMVLAALLTGAVPLTVS